MFIKFCHQSPYEMVYSNNVQPLKIVSEGSINHKYTNIKQGI